LAELLNNWHPEIRLLYSDLRAAACGDAIGPPTGHRLLCQAFHCGVRTYAEQQWPAEPAGGHRLMVELELRATEYSLLI
jgi:hypothetical protein